MEDGKSFGAPLVTLTEDEVKRRFVPFLKDFYKNRYQSDPAAIQVELDNVSEEGWVADGKLTFRKEDGSPFICTYEATSRDKADEVRYQLNSMYFLWDCSAFAAVCMAVAYLFFYETRLNWLIQLKLAGNIGLLMGVFIIGFFGWYFTMQKWRKYRYIYAIQQFRQYFADEQWIALAEDVFPSRNDPYFIELRNQCVYNGVGLAIVPFEGNTQKICDPSRLGIYGKDRKMTEWVTRAEWYRRMSGGIGAMAARRPKAPDALTALWNRIYRPVHYLLIDPFKKYIWSFVRKPLGETTTVYARFMSAQKVQKWVAALALVFIVPLFVKVYNYKTEEMADLEELKDWKKGKNPEDEYGYQIDGEAIPYDGKPTGVPKQYPIPNTKEEEDGPVIDISHDDDEEENVINLSGDEEPVKKPAVKPAASKPTPKATSPCEQLNRKGWIIQESSFKTRDLALAHLSVLKKKGIDCQYAEQSCLPGSQLNGYVIWLGPVYASEASARKSAEGYEKALQRYGLLKGKLFVRSLK